MGEMATPGSGHSGLGRGGGRVELGGQSEGRLGGAATGPQVGDK